tara:strand:+ start:176 stop:700 length:525 start_codon:yes stop_codon:yes gene_type:complete
MAQKTSSKNKKQAAKTNESPAPSEPAAGLFVKTEGGRDTQVGSLRMRSSDFLDACKKNMDEELRQQQAALAHGKEGLQTLRVAELEQMAKTLESIITLFSMPGAWVKDPTAKKNIELKSRYQKQIARAKGLANGTLKAMSKEEAEARQAEAAAKREAALKALAEADLLEDSLNI